MKTSLGDNVNLDSGVTTRVVDRTRVNFADRHFELLWCSEEISLQNLKTMPLLKYLWKRGRTITHCGLSEFVVGTVSQSSVELQNLKKSKATKGGVSDSLENSSECGGRS
jgi:hypothetical protein